MDGRIVQYTWFVIGIFLEDLRDKWGVESLIACILWHGLRRHLYNCYRFLTVGVLRVPLRDGYMHFGLLISIG